MTTITRYQINKKPITLWDEVSKNKFKIIQKQHGFYGNQYTQKDNIRVSIYEDPSNWTMFKLGSIAAIILLTIACGLFLHFYHPEVKIISPIGHAHADFEPEKVNTSAEIKLTPTVIPATANPMRISTPVGTKDKQYIYTKKHADILWRIYGLESSFGKNNYKQCKIQGLYNYFGYDVADTRCYQTFEANVDAVDNWIEQHSDLTIRDMLCMYNMGRVGNCTYADNFLSL